MRRGKGGRGDGESVRREKGRERRQEMGKKDWKSNCGRARGGMTVRIGGGRRQKNGQVGNEKKRVKEIDTDYLH